MRAVRYCGLACLLLIVAVPVVAGAVAAPGQYSLGRINEVGGSNYLIYKAAPNGGLGAGSQLVVGTYHQNPSAVQAQLQSLYNSGQRKITIPIFFGPFNPIPANPEPNVYEHLVNSIGGQLAPQHKDNLRNVLRWVQSLGFNEVIIRFAPQGGASPCAANAPWTTGWSESQYQENLAFVISTRTVVESVLSSTTVKRTYDLGLELGGSPDGMQPGCAGNNGQIVYAYGSTYMKRLWMDYYARFGAADTYGFSVPAGTDRMDYLISQYDLTGVRPSAYAIDVYGTTTGIYNALVEAYDDMVAKGEGNKPLIIQETYADDSQAASAIVSFLNARAATVKHVTQWFVYRNQLAVNQTAAARYYNYGGPNTPHAAIVAAPCVLGSGASSCTAQIAWSSAYSVFSDLRKDGVVIASSPIGYMPVTMSAPAHFDFVIPAVLDTLDLGPLPTGTPVLDYQGGYLTGDYFDLVTATGTGIESQCSVGMFSPTWTFLGSVTTASCLPNKVTFAVPAAVQQNYDSLIFNVTNLGSGKWSEPIAVVIDQPSPALYKSGLGGVGNTSVWATASNVTPICSVSIFTPNWSGLLTTLSGASVSCQPDGISFGIPAWIRQQYSAINFNVNNSYGKWSQPLYQSTH